MSHRQVLQFDTLPISGWDSMTVETKKLTRL